MAPLHLLICPVVHTADFQSTPPETFRGIAEIVQELARQLEIENDYQLLVNNGASAGQKVFHIHAHLLSHSAGVAQRAAAITA